MKLILFKLNLKLNEFGLNFQLNNTELGTAQPQLVLELHSIPGEFVLRPSNGVYDAQNGHYSGKK